MPGAGDGALAFKHIIDNICFELDGVLKNMIIDRQLNSKQEVTILNFICSILLGIAGIENKDWIDNVSPIITASVKSSLQAMIEIDIDNTEYRTRKFVFHVIKNMLEYNLRDIMGDIN